MKWRINDKFTDKAYALFVILLMSNIDILTLNNILFGMGTLYRALQILLYTSMIALLAISYRRVLRVKKDSVFLLVLVFTLFVISYLGSAQTREVIAAEKLIRGVFFSGITGYIFIRNIKDVDVFIDMMEKVSYFMVSYGAIVLLLGDIGKGYMGFAYAILIYVLLLLYFWLFRKSTVDAVFGILGVLIEIVGGARAILLCVAFMLLVYFLFSKKWKRAFLFVVFIILLYFGFGYTLSTLYRIMQLVGIESRTLLVYSNLGLEGIVYANGRTTIYNAALNLIKSNPLGYGFLGERAQLNNLIWWFKTNGYAHNVFLELILQFGIIFGTCLAGALLAIIVKAVRKGNFEISINGLFLVFLSYNVHLLVSRSYTTSFQFWAMLGFIYLILQKRNKEKVEQIIP